MVIYKLNLKMMKVVLMIREGLMGFILSALAASMIPIPSSHAETPVPWECFNYSVEAQSRCLNAFIEQQREQIGRLQGQVQAQQDAMKQMKEQMDKQAAASANMQQQLSQSTSTVIAPTVVPPAYAYSYMYPPTIGFGLYLGRPSIYGPPYYYHPYWGPRFYGHWGRRW